MNMYAHIIGMNNLSPCNIVKRKLIQPMNEHIDSLQQQSCRCLLEKGVQDNVNMTGGKVDNILRPTNKVNYIHEKLLSQKKVFQIVKTKM